MKSFKFEIRASEENSEAYLIWEKINQQSENTSFVNSIAWLNFQKQLSKQIFKYHLVLLTDQETIIVGNLSFEKNVRRFTKYAYAPYSPVIDWNNLIEITNQSREILLPKILNSLKEFFQKFIQENNLTVFRFDPQFLHSEIKYFKDAGFVSSLAPGYPKFVNIINLEPSLDEIMGKMNKTKRYVVKKALKEELDFFEASSAKDVEDFINLIKETSDRKGFQIHFADYYKKQFEFLNKEGLTKIFLVKHKNKILSGALINFYKDSAYYSFAGSSDNVEVRQLNSAYFLIWKLVEYLKSNNYKNFNLWGVLPDSYGLRVTSYEKTQTENINPETRNSKPKTRHPLKGVSDFKKSFGGETINYSGIFETYINPIKYKVNRIYDWWFYRNDRI